MNNYFINKAYKSIKHLGSIGAIVSLSIVFASFSVFSIISLSNELSKIFISNIREIIGGDVIVDIPLENLEKTETLLKDMEKEGNVNKYTTIAFTYNSQVLDKNSGIRYIQLTGIKDKNFPLIDIFTLRSGKTLYELVQEPNSIVISKDVAQKLGKDIGDELIIFGYDPIYNYKYKIVDIIDSNSARQGDIAYTSYDSFQNNFKDKYVKILVLGDTDKITENLDKNEIAYTTVANVTEDNKKVEKILTLFFRGMSILGLFIGCLGIVSSMDVLITKRRPEIATLKTVGYKHRHIISMFLYELLGFVIIGNIVGIAGGFVFYRFLINMLNSAFNGAVMKNGFDINAMLIALIGSLISTVIFTLYIIVQNLEFKPADLLRNNLEFSKKRKISFKKLFMLLLIFVSFGLLSTVIVHNLLVGFGVVMFAVVGIFLSNIIFRILIWLILRLPLKTKNIFGLVWINLRTSYKKSILGIIAIFVGITCIGLIYAMYKTSNDELAKQLGKYKATINIIVFSNNNNLEEQDKIEKLIKTDKEVKEYSKVIRYLVPEKNFILSDVIEARDPKNFGNDFIITEGVFENSEGLFIPEGYRDSYPIGTEIAIADNKIKIDGYIKVNQDITSIGGEGDAFIVTKDWFTEHISGQYQTMYMISTSDDDIKNLADKFRDISGLLVFDLVNLNKQIQKTILNLVWVVISIASLALLAGTILLINTATLEVINRKHDFGILKAIGFKNGQIRTLFILEFGLLIILASVMAYIVDFITIIIINKIQPWGLDEPFYIIFDKAGTLGIIVSTTILIIILLYFSARKYLGVKPIELLRHE